VVIGISARQRGGGAHDSPMRKPCGSETLLFASAAVLTAFDRRAIALVLVFAYIFPAAIRLTLDT